MWPLVVVVLDEFPVEREPRMFELVGSEPTFDLSERRGLTDSAEDMLDPMVLTVCVEKKETLFL